MCSVVPTTGCISPVHRPLILCAFRKKNWKCLLISIIIYACLIASLTCWMHRQEAGDAGCLRSHSFIPLSLFLIFYVIYLIECWRNSPNLQPIVSRAAVQQHIHLLRHSAPVIWWRVVCYHFVRRSRQIVRYRNGVPSTTTQVFYERTNSHVDEQEFDYSTCGVRDVSHDVINLEKHSLVVIDFTKCFSFSDLVCENQYLGQRCDFFRSNEGWDSYLEAKEGMKLRNVEWNEQFVVCEDPEHPPLYACQQFYWLCSLFLSSWFLRVYLDHKAAIVNYQVEKLFGDPGPMDGDGPWNPLARVATMDSTEMEWQIQTNQLVAPTYEQATGVDMEQGVDFLPTTVRPNAGNVQVPRRYTTAERPLMHRTRSWAREGRRYGIMTTFRRSMTQLFGRNLPYPDDDDDVTLLPDSSHRQTFHPEANRPLSEAPPTYSEAMSLHRILGFYDENNPPEEYDITRSDCNLHRINGEGANGAANRSRFKFYRRRRPSNLRVRSQYRPTSACITPSSRARSGYTLRDVITGPAAVTQTTEQQRNGFSAPGAVVLQDASDSEGLGSINTLLSNSAPADNERTPILDPTPGDYVAPSIAENSNTISPPGTYGATSENVPTSI